MRYISGLASLEWWFMTVRIVHQWSRHWYESSDIFFSHLPTCSPREGDGISPIWFFRKPRTVEKVIPINISSRRWWYFFDMCSSLIVTAPKPSRIGTAESAVVPAWLGHRTHLRTWMAGDKNKDLFGTCHCSAGDAKMKGAGNGYPKLGL